MLAVDSLRHLLSLKCCRLRQHFELFLLLDIIVPVFFLDISLELEQHLRLVKLSCQVLVLVLHPHDLSLDALSIWLGRRLLVGSLKEPVVLPGRVLILLCQIIDSLLVGLLIKAVQVSIDICWSGLLTMDGFKLGLDFRVLVLDVLALALELLEFGIEIGHLTPARLLIHLCLR